jgi:hypothetical protein
VSPLVSLGLQFRSLRKQPPTEKGGSPAALCQESWDGLGIAGARVPRRLVRLDRTRGYERRSEAAKPESRAVDILRRLLGFGSYDVGGKMRLRTRHSTYVTASHPVRQFQNHLDVRIFIFYDISIVSVIFGTFKMIELRNCPTSLADDGDGIRSFSCGKDGDRRRSLR